MRVRLDFYQSAARFEIFHDLFTRDKAVESLVFARGGVHSAVVVHHADHFQIVAQPHFEVVRIVRGRDLHRAAAEFHIHVIVRNNGDLSSHEGQNERLAH